MRLYLIRHGHTAPTGPTAHLWPLSPEGEVQARALTDAPFWKGISDSGSRSIISSPEKKALATVMPSAERYRLMICVDERLHEARRPSGWINEYDATVRNWFARPDEPPAGWESAAAALDRVTNFIDEVTARHHEEQVAVCSHGLLLTLYISSLHGAVGEAHQLWRSMGFGTVAVVESGRLVGPFGDPMEVRG